MLILLLGFFSILDFEQPVVGRLYMELFGCSNGLFYVYFIKIVVLRRICF